MIKNYKQFNESLKDKLVGPTEDEVLGNLKNLSPNELLKKSCKKGFFKGVEIALEKGADIDIAFNYSIGFQDKELYNFLLTKGSVGNLNLAFVNINSLPDGLLIVGGDLYLGNSNITSLPDGLTVGGDLDLGGNSDLGMSKIISLPKELTVGGYLNLNNTKISSLPYDIKLGGDLYLSDKYIISLPDGLTVGGNLKLGCTPINTLPKDLIVKGKMFN